MSVAFQAYSVGPSLLERLVADPAAVDEFLRSTYCQDAVEDDFEAKWLDKSGMGILEAFGALDGSIAPPALWL